MGSARATASAVLGLVRDIQSPGGGVSALAHYGLQNLAGRPAAEVFERLIDVLCPDGGTVDEAIAREGMLEAIETFADIDTPFEALTVDQLEEFVVAFITATIEGRVVNDVGTKIVSMPADIAKLENIETQVHDAIEGCVRQAVANTPGGVTALEGQKLSHVVESIYQGAFDLLSALAGEA